MPSEADMGTNPNTHRATKSQGHRVHDGRRASAHCLSTLQPSMARHCARALDRREAGNLKNDQNCSSRRKRLRTLANTPKATLQTAYCAESVLLHIPHHRTIPAASSAATFLATVART
eukprot:scaffold17553_cov112-Isochrysis_galbana.AAC.3